MTTINPEILVWARKSANLTREQAVKKLSIKDTQKMCAVERLIAFENGTNQPPRSMLDKMAKQYYRPLLSFYLEKPPKSASRGVDFRKLPADKVELDDTNLDILLRDVRVRQSMVKAALEDEDEIEKLEFVGARSIADGKFASLQLIKKVLNMDIQAYRNQAAPTAAFSLLRQHTEKSGIFVLLKSDLGSFHTAIEADVFRGFVIADDIAPFIVINERDAVPACSFTLVHELVHLILGNTGISGLHADDDEEMFCNDVAREYLLPRMEMKLLDIHQSDTATEREKKIDKFARKRHLSRTMVAYAALREGLLDSETFGILASKFRNQWKLSRDKKSNNQGMPSYYTVRRHRIGRGLLFLVDRMMVSGNLTTTKAAKILGVKPQNIQKLLNSGTLQ